MRYIPIILTAIQYLLISLLSLPQCNFDFTQFIICPFNAVTYKRSCRPFFHYWPEKNRITLLSSRCRKIISCLTLEKYKTYSQDLKQKQHHINQTKTSQLYICQCLQTNSVQLSRFFLCSWLYKLHSYLVMV